jgi:hypothetical protein
LVTIAAIFGGLLIHILSFNVTFATSELEEDTGGGDSDGGDQSEPESESESEPGLIPEPEPSIDPCEENPEAEGCEPQPPIDPCIEDPTAEGCESAPVPPPRVPEPPDDDCLYDPSLPKCAPIDGECPEGFNMNEDGQCFPDKPCPTGFERRDEDETGRCYPDSNGSPSPPPIGNETTPTTNQTTPTTNQTTPTTNQTTTTLTPLQISTDKKTYNIGEKVAITVKNNGNESLSFSDSLLGILIRNLDTGESFGLGIALQVITELPPGESRTFQWNQKVNNEGEQVKSGNYRVSVAGAIASIGNTPVYANADFKIVPSQPPPPPPINVVIVNQINTEIKNYYSTTTTPTPTSCTTPQEKAISLGPGTMTNNGIRVLAVFDPCRLVDGGAIFNLPNNNNNLKLLAVDLEGSGSNAEVHKVVVMELQRIQRITNDQILYNIGFRETVTGESPITDNTDTIEDINALFLWNDSPGQINFVDDNSVALNAILSSSN